MLDRKRTKAELYLENLQMKWYGQYGDPETLFNKRLLDSKIIGQRISQQIREMRHSSLPDVIEEEKKYAKLLQEVKDMIPSRYEDPDTYILMLDLYDEIQDSLKFLHATNPNSQLGDHFNSSGDYKYHVFGHLPLGSVNAMTIAVPSSEEHLVIFEEELFTFCHLLSKIIARSMPFKENKSFDNKHEGQYSTFSSKLGDIRRNIAENQQIVVRFKDLVLSYLVGGRPSAAKQYLLEEPYSKLGSVFTDSIELFVMAHEHSHILLKHSNGKDSTPSRLGNDIKEIIYPWDEEYLADYFGLYLMFIAMQKRGFDASMSFCGVDSFFTATEIIDQGKSILNGTESLYESGTENPYRYQLENIQKSHPPPLLRRDLLRTSVEEWYGKSALGMANAAEKILNILWADSRDLVRKEQENRKA